MATFKDFLTGRGLTKTIGLELLSHNTLREHIFLNKYGINCGTMLIPIDFSKLAQAEGVLKCCITAWGAVPGSTSSRVRSSRTRSSARATCPLVPEGRQAQGLGGD